MKLATPADQNSHNVCLAYISGVTDSTAKILKRKGVENNIHTDTKYQHLTMTHKGHIRRSKSISPTTPDKSSIAQHTLEEHHKICSIRKRCEA